MSIESKKQFYKETMQALKQSFENEGGCVEPIEGGCRTFANVEEGMYVRHEQELPDVEKVFLYFTKAVEGMDDDLVVKATFKKQFQAPHPRTYLPPVAYNNYLAAMIACNFNARMHGQGSAFDVERSTCMLDLNPEAKKAADQVREFVRRATIGTIGKEFEEKNIWDKTNELRFATTVNESRT